VDRRKLGWLVVVAAALGVVAASLVSPSSLPSPARLGSDKLQHTAAYFVLALVSLYATETDNYKVAVVVFALGVCVELAQSFVPHRTASAADIAANGFGVAAAVVVALLVERAESVRKV